MYTVLSNKNIAEHEHVPLPLLANAVLDCVMKEPWQRLLNSNYCEYRPPPDDDDDDDPRIVIVVVVLLYRR